MSAWRPASGSGTRAQWAVLSVLLAAGLAWLCWPVWGSGSAPTFAQAEEEAPFVMAALVAGLVALGAAVWHDGGRRASALAPVAGLVVLDCVVRSVLSPGLGGVEFVFVVPLLAGAALGAPSGFLVGAGAAIASTVLVSEPSSALPVQALVWGLVGAAAGALRPLPSTPAWLLAVPTAFALGIGVGFLFNLPGWSYTAGSTTTHFAPGLPPGEVISRLWQHGLATSFVLDATRGAVTALGVAALGLPILRALRPLPDHRLRVTTAQSTRDIRPEALERRAAAPSIDSIWN